MSLPKIALSTAEVVVGDEKVAIRSLSRSEAMQLVKFQGDADAGEDWVLACGAGVTVEEAHAWRLSAPVDAVGPIVDAILEISGLTEGASKSG